MKRRKGMGPMRRISAARSSPAGVTGAAPGSAASRGTSRRDNRACNRRGSVGRSRQTAGVRCRGRGRGVVGMQTGPAILELDDQFDGSVMLARREVEERVLIAAGFRQKPFPSEIGLFIL